MANLLDLVTTAAPPTHEAVPQDLQPRWEAATTEQERAQWLTERTRTHRAGDKVTKWATKVVTEADEAVDKLCWESFVNTDQLPVPMKDRASPALVKMMSTPRAPLSSILDVTEKLGFVILPFAYLDEKAYASEDRGMRTAITEFGALDDNLDVYVVCPPTYYSLEKHLASDDPNKPIYAGRNAQAFMALRMTIPTLRSMQVQIDVLEKNQKTMRNDYDRMRFAVEQTVANMNTLQEQMSTMQRDVSTQLQQMNEQIGITREQTTRSAVEAAARVAEIGDQEQAERARSILAALGPESKLVDAQEALAQLEGMVWSIEEPLLFAIKPGTSLQDRKALAFIGPCWGPDFEDIIAVAVDLAVDSDRREAAEKMLDVWKPKRQRVLTSSGGRFREDHYYNGEFYGSGGYRY